MVTIYVASTETFVGKSAVCVGLLDRAQRDGLTIGYMKPVSMSVSHDETNALNEDADFIRQYFHLPDPLDRVAPVLITQALIEQFMRGQSLDLPSRLNEAYNTLMFKKQFIVLEGTNTFSEASIVELAADQVTEILQAPVLLIVHYRSLLTIDEILTSQRYFGDRLLGVLINQVHASRIDYVRTRLVPFLENHGITVFGTIVEDSILAGITVHALNEYLGGQVIGQPEWENRVIERFMIGAMGADTALAFFQRDDNKAVITGGDRSDLLMVALETSTSALVLTGNRRPSSQVIDRAEELHVPILLVTDDTLTTIERAERIFKHVRFMQTDKIKHLTKLMDQSFDFERLYDKLGLVVR